MEGDGRGEEGMGGEMTGGECCGVKKILKIDPDIRSGTDSFIGRIFSF